MVIFDEEYLAGMVRKAQTGDSDAFAELFAATYREQYRYIYACTEDAYLAQMYLQEVYILALQNIRNLKNPRIFVTWMHYITIRFCADFEKGTAEPEELEKKTANQILNNVLILCEMEPSIIPVEILESWGNYKKPRYRAAYSVIGIFLIILILLPVLFLKPEITTKRIPSGSDFRVEYHIRIHSIFPVSVAEAKLDGETVALEKVSAGEFIVDLTRNGILTVDVSVLNGQKVREEYTISYIDTEKPEFLSYEGNEKVVRIKVRDVFSGVDYENISGADPIAYDEDTGVIEFLIPEKETTVVIPDHAGNELALALVPLM